METTDGVVLGGGVVVCTIASSLPINVRFLERNIPIYQYNMAF